MQPSCPVLRESRMSGYYSRMLQPTSSPQHRALAYARCVVVARARGANAAMSHRGNARYAARLCELVRAMYHCLTSSANVVATFMRHYAEHELAGLVSLEEAVGALDAAFRAFAGGRASVQRRMTTAANRDIVRPRSTRRRPTRTTSSFCCSLLGTGTFSPASMRASSRSCARLRLPAWPQGTWRVRNRRILPYSVPASRHAPTSRRWFGSCRSSR